MLRFLLVVQKLGYCNIHHTILHGYLIHIFIVTVQTKEGNTSLELQ